MTVEFVSVEEIRGAAQLAQLNLQNMELSGAEL